MSLRHNRLVKGSLALVGFGAIFVGGFDAASDPIPPSPGAKQQPIAEWSGRPLLPDALNKILSSRLPTDHQNDFSSSIKVFQDPSVGNYAVMENSLYGQSSVTTTVTCTPEDTMKMTYDPGKHLFGRAFFLQQHEFDSPAARQTCSAGGVSIDGLKAFISNPA